MAREEGQAVASIMHYVLINIMYTYFCTHVVTFEMLAFLLRFPYLLWVTSSSGGGRYTVGINLVFRASEYCVLLRGYLDSNEY
jgi:hypothetical protein